MRQVAKKISFTILKNYKKLTKKWQKSPKKPDARAMWAFSTNIITETPNIN